MDFEIPARDPAQARRARRLHRARDQAARARAHPVLRPPPRVRAHRLRERRRARAGSGRSCCGEMRRRADAAGHLRYALPEGAAAARTARTSRWRSSASTSRAKGLGLHNDLQNESSIVGNFPTVHHDASASARPEQKTRVPRGHDHGQARASASGSPSRTTAATPPGSRRRAVRDGDDWVINGEEALQHRPAQRQRTT